MAKPTNADLRPGPDRSPAAAATQPPPSTQVAEWWQVSGNETEDACYLVERWVDRELELIQLPLDVITLAAEQVQDVRLTLLENAGETTWPELLVSAFLGFMTNSPYGGQLIQLVTTRALRSVLNSSALLQASQTYSRRSTVEFFRYAGELYRYVPAQGSMTPSPISTRQIAELYDSLKTFLSNGASYALETGRRALETGRRALENQAAIQGITEGLSQSAVTLGQGALGNRPSAVPAADSPGVSLLDECMQRAAAHRHLTRAAAAGLISQVRAGRVSGAQVAAQIPPPIKENLTHYRRRARLQAEALLWVQLVPVRRGITIGQLFAFHLSGLDTEASDKLVAYWRDRFGPLIAGSERHLPTKPPQPANTPMPNYGQVWRDAAAQLGRAEQAYRAASFPAMTEGKGLRDARDTLDTLVLRYLSELREDLQSEIDAVRTPPT